MSVFTLYTQNVNYIYELWWDEGKQGANMLNHVATLVSQDQFYFSPYFLRMAIAFLGIAAMLRDQFLAIAGVEYGIFYLK